MADKKKEIGTGLGLDQFLAPKPSDNGDKPAEEAKKEEKPKEEEVKPEETKKEEVKKEDAETHQTPTDKEVDKKPEETPEKKEIEDESEEDKKGNYKKRYKDTSIWANDVHQKNIAHEKKIAELEKKLNDPYGDTEPKEISPEQKQNDAALQGRVEASFEMAKSKYGVDYIADNIENPACEYQKLRKENPAIDIRVSYSKTPFLEAVKVLKEEQFFKEYGRDTEKIVEKIKEGSEKELREKITKELQEKLVGKEKLPNGIGSAAGSIIGNENKDTQKATPFSKMFAHG